MALHGIDVSSWQGDVYPQKLEGVEFCIAKATEGLSYVNPYCDLVVQRCIGAGMPWGFYHFAKDNGPEEEAAFFIANCSGYFGWGIPVLDWEGEQTVEWVNAFVRKVHADTGIWPWIYGNPWRFNKGGVEPSCGRWIAHYDKNQRTTLDWQLPDIPKTDGLVACWQYTDNGKVPGFSGSLDLNRFYGDSKAWEAYARGDGDAKYVASASVLENDEYRVTIERL